MPEQPLEPGELVVKLWTRLRVAVRRVDRGDDDAIDCRFDVATLGNRSLLLMERLAAVDGDRARLLLKQGDGRAVMSMTPGNL